MQEAQNLTLQAFDRRSPVRRLSADSRSHLEYAIQVPTSLPRPERSLRTASASVALSSYIPSTPAEIKHHVFHNAEDGGGGGDLFKRIRNGPVAKVLLTAGGVVLTIVLVSGAVMMLL